MKRRDFIKLVGTGSALFSVSPGAFGYHDEMAPWRGFRLTYHVELPERPGKARLWLPLPAAEDSHHQRSLGSVWNGTADEARFQTVSPYSVPIFYAEWRKPGPRTVTVGSIVKTTDRSADFSTVSVGRNVALPAEVKKYLLPTEHMPVDGIVRTTARTITNGASTPLEKARAIYEWIVDNTFREAPVGRCGLGNIKSMLETGNLGGKCADINSLFVGLARAAGIPAREAYGLRVAESGLFKSLGAYGDISTAQHWRAEFYLAGVGWVPVDPADVRKVVLEENLRLDDTRVVALRKKLFGYWEMNWVEFNHGRDFALAPDVAAGKLPFFAYPHAEIGGKPQDGLDPVSFAYRIESRELVGTGGKF